jgi:hypothetical protein
VYFSRHKLSSLYILGPWMVAVNIGLDSEKMLFYSIIKPTRCTNFTNLFWHETTCFGQFLCPSSAVYSLCTQQWYMSYRFVDSFRAGPGCSCSKAVYKPVLHIPLLSAQWMNSWWWAEELSETCSFMPK